MKQEFPSAFMARRREATVEGTWTPADLELPLGCSLSIEDPATRVVRYKTLSLLT